MLKRRQLLLSMAAMGLANCSRSKFQSYEGPEVTQIIIEKDRRLMFLMNEQNVLEHFEVELGFTADGHKQFEGDGKTPEGHYFIDRRNPKSAFHLSLGISYPNRADRRFAAAAGKNPGGDIFIHGRPNGVRKRKDLGPDWTAGCISVNNKEMELVYAMVRTGTPIYIAA
ncbi:MAG: L,D-transpeptidase family protein [Pseudomonadota bacterium]